MAALQLCIHLSYDGGWNRIPLLWDVIELFSTDAHVSLAVSLTGGRATQPHDSGLGNSLRNPAAREQSFEDVESWKPRLIVAYFPDWTPGLFRRQRAGETSGNGNARTVSGPRGFD